MASPSTQLQETGRALCLAEKIQRLLTDRGVPAGELAARIGLSAAHFQNCIEFSRPFTHNHVYMIARLFYVSCDWLCNDAAGWPPPSNPPSPFTVSLGVMPEDASRDLLEKLEAAGRAFQRVVELSRSKGGPS